MEISSIISFAGAALCSVLAGATLVLKRRSLPWLLFAVGTLLLAADATLGGLALAATSAEQLLHWQKLRLMVLAFVPGTWLMFSLCYSRGNYREFLTKWRPILALAYGIPAVTVLGFRENLISGASFHEAGGEVFIRLGWPGRLLFLVVLMCSVLIL